MFTQDKKISYYLSRISENIGETPEGYLICKNVPIARVGSQEYLGQELGLSDKYDQEVSVYRSPEEVFDEVAMSSFEGKPLTDEHPPVQIDVNNITQYSKGHVQNVHRCTNDPNLLVADLIVQDPVVIAKIRDNVKREISCGYDCYYVPYKDGYKQFEIRGNHIALVSKGRAGSHVSIKDNFNGRKKIMAKKSILAAMLKAFAKDADPEEVAAAVDAINQRDADEEKAKILESLKSKKESTESEDDDPMAKVMDRLDSLESKFGSLLEKKGSLEEDSKFCQDEDPDEDSDEEDEDSDEDDTEEEGERVTVSKDSLNLLKSSIAKIRSPKDRKKMVDALYNVLGTSRGSNGVYSKINSIAAKTKDSYKSDTVDFSDLGRKIAAKYNPHYKENN